MIFVVSVAENLNIWETEYPKGIVIEGHGTFGGNFTKFMFEDDDLENVLNFCEVTPVNSLHCEGLQYL